MPTSTSTPEQAKQQGRRPVRPGEVCTSARMGDGPIEPKDAPAVAFSIYAVDAGRLTMEMLQQGEGLAGRYDLGGGYTMAGEDGDLVVRRDGVELARGSADTLSSVAAQLRTCPSGEVEPLR